MKKIALLMMSGLGLLATSFAATPPQVEHTLTVNDIPTGAKVARVWMALPRETEEQSVHDLKINAPVDYEVHDSNGNRLVYFEVQNPTETITLQTTFKIERHDSFTAVSGPTVEKATTLAHWVVNNTDHYSKGGPKSSGLGSASYCLAHKGGGCTDQHALFMSLAADEGIKTRIRFGVLLKADKRGEMADAGYRCWVQYEASGYGWISMDLSAVDTLGDERFYTGVDANRIDFTEGRGFDLTPRQGGKAPDPFCIAYVEIDGKPHKAIKRTIKH